MMRSMEDYNNGGSTTPEISTASNNIHINNNFEFHKGNANGGGRSSSTRISSHHNHHHRTSLGKPTPSKWDDAQKWLVGLSRVGGGGGGEKNQKNKPRNSNADDRRLIAPVPQKEEQEEDYYSSGEDADETKKVDFEEDSISMLRINKPVADDSISVGFGSICLRDMGTEMTPIASQEPSRTATPIRSSTPAARSPLSSGSSTPVRSKNGGGGGGVQGVDKASKAPESKDSDQARKLSPLEARALAWDEAERAKYTARYNLLHILDCFSIICRGWKGLLDR